MKDSAGLDEFFKGKSAMTLGLFEHFVAEFREVNKVTVHPAKTMIGIATAPTSAGATVGKRVAYVTRLGKDFILVVFPFDRPYADNLCFEKIAQVPGDKQHNHYFRMQSKEDVNAEVRRFMKLAVKLGRRSS